MQQGKPNHDNTNNKIKAHDKFELRKGGESVNAVDVVYNLIRHTYEQNSSYSKGQSRVGIHFLSNWNTM